MSRIEHAYIGMEAVEIAALHPYKFIIMDIKMPVIGGIEAIKILRENNPDQVIIAQTAYFLPEEAEGIMAAGCDNILAKPVKRELLMEMINKYN